MSPIHLTRPGRRVWVLAVLLGAAIGPNTASAETQTYTYEDSLSNSYTRIYQGQRDINGDCIWPVPALTSGHSGGGGGTTAATMSEELPPPPGSPSDSDVEARQVWANFDNCTTAFQIGVPTSKKKEPSDLEEFGKDSDSGVTASSASQITAAWKARKVYYQVAWWDSANFMVNRVRSYIAWSYNGVNCIPAPQSSYTGTWHLEPTGWFRTSTGWRKETLCSNQYHYSDATFANPFFCWSGNTVRSHYDDVRVRAGFRGDYGGVIGRTWTSGACPGFPLHMSAKLVKVFG